MATADLVFTWHGCYCQYCRPPQEKMRRWYEMALQAGYSADEARGYAESTIWRPDIGLAIRGIEGQ
jgi:hypothetical protein